MGLDAAIIRHDNTRGRLAAVSSLCDPPPPPLKNPGYAPVVRYPAKCILIDILLASCIDVRRRGLKYK